MPLFIQKIPHLLFGVSQRPNVQKDPSQLQSSDNWFARAAYGLAKRPPFEFLGKLTSSLTGISGAAIFSVQRDDDDRYRVVIQNGTIKAYDLLNDGVEVTIKDLTSGSDTYLTDTAGAGFRQVTVGDATFIANRGKTVGMKSTKTTAQNPYALVTVEQADFSTYYEIELQGVSFDTVSVTQGDSTSRGAINTTDIAQALYEELTTGESASTVTPSFTIARYGSTIFIQSKGTEDFNIDVFDGLSDNGLRLIKGRVQDAEDLVFTRAPHGTKVKVTGDAASEKDDFWLEYQSDMTDVDEDGTSGVWQETVAPGISYQFDPLTMPHRLGWKVSQLGGWLPVTNLPPQATVEDHIASTNEFGWNYDQDDGAVDEIDDDVITVDKYGRRRILTSSDGTTRQRATVYYDVDTSRVPYGKATIVELKHIDGTTSIETVLAQKHFSPGETFEFQRFIVYSNDKAEGIWAVNDKFQLLLKYGDGEVAETGEEAQLTMLGYRTAGNENDRYIPIRIDNYGGIDVTFNGGSGDVYPEGAYVEVVMAYTDIVDTFIYVVPTGGATKFEAATGVAAAINAGGGTVDYTAVATSNTVRIYVTADPSADPTYSSISIEYYTNKCQLPGTFTLNEFAGETIVNMTDGSSGTISANTTDGLFTATLTGGVDNKFQPGDRIRIDGSGGYFVWEAMDWDDRAVGDEVTNPNPSFVDTTIRDVFFYRNRLGFVAGRGIVLSESGDLVNFWRSSVQQLLDGDRIDVESAHGDVAIFHSAVPWNKTLYLWSENAQYEMYGEPVLSPKTVKLDVVSRYFNTPNVRPEVIGPRLYFAHKQAGSVKIMEWLPPTDEITQYMARDITQDVPTYLSGNAVDIAGDYAHGCLAVICDGDQDSLYVWSFTPKGDGTNIHEAWQRWTLPAGVTARQIDFADGKLGLLYSYSDGVYFDEADVDQAIAGSTMGFLDRRVSNGDSGVSAVHAGGTTTFTFPYPVATNGSEGTIAIWDKTNGAELTVASRPSTTTATVTGDYSAINFDLGIDYTARAKLAPLYLRGDGRESETGGRTQVRELDVQYNNTESLKVEVTPSGRSKYTHTVTNTSPTEGRKRVPVLSRGETTVVEIVSDAPGDARVNSIDVEMQHSNRSRRA